MASTKYKIGDLISVCDERNSLGLVNFHGLNINKEFMPTVADTEGLDESKYKVVRKRRFVFSGMQTGRDKCIRISMYSGNEPIIVSPAYTTFEISREDIVLPEYFFMIFRSKEKDRWGAFCSDGSIRTNLDWERFIDFYITLPSIEQQQKYVNIYSSLKENLFAYQSKIDDLKLVCDSYIENLRRNIQSTRIGDYIKKEEKNSDGKIKRVLGIGQSGFILPQKDPNESLKNYKVLRKGDICYAPPLFNMLTGALHCFLEDEDAVCSPIYEVFKCDESRLLPEYLTLWLKRDEFIRYAEFFAQGVRQTFDYSLMEDIKIPIPDIVIQQSIVNIFRVYKERKEIAEQLKVQIKNLCPILIKGSLSE